MRKITLILVVLILIALVVFYYPRPVEKPIKDGEGPLAVYLNRALPLQSIIARWITGKPTTWTLSTGAILLKPIACTVMSQSGRAITVIIMLVLTKLWIALRAKQSHKQFREKLAMSEENETTKTPVKPASSVFSSRRQFIQLQIRGSGGGLVGNAGPG